jgi:perosamine synthetase
MLNNEFILFHKPYVTDDEISEIVDTVKSGWWTTGPKTQKFENMFAGYIGTKNAVSASSWTAAAHLALEAIGLKEGDEVIVPACTFTSTAEVVCYFKAKPVIVDIDKKTLNILPGEIEKAITSRTKAIIPVHVGGMPCDMDEINEIAKAHGLYVLEDAAHALPAIYKDKKIGQISDFTCYSFYATKPLATGEGGMICTNNDEVAERCRIMRLHGINKDAWKRYTAEGSWYYEVIAPGFKYNFTDLQAALGLAQLKKIEMLWQLRKDIAKRYNEAFSNNQLVSTPASLPDRQSSLHLYQINLNIDALKINRSEFIDKLKEEGVGTSVHFIPLYRHPYYRDAYGLDVQNYPNCEEIFPRMISLPIWPGMSDEQVAYVVEIVLNLLNKNKR